MPTAPPRACARCHQPARGRCPCTKGSWGQGSTRAGRKARTAALNRDRHQCQLRYDGCTGTATEADHITSITALGQSRADATNPNALQGACHHCHTIKTNQQATQARR
jgi:5-methylcytosine-specific restriction protein A